MILKLINAGKKYGLGAPLYYVEWKIKKSSYKNLARKIKTKGNRLSLHFVSKVKSVPWNISNEERNNILSGQRKILFFENYYDQKKDIKYQWEINRKHYLFWMAHSCHCINERKKFEEEIKSIDVDLVLFQTNGMEVAIFCVNLLVAVQETVEWNNHNTIIQFANSIIEQCLYYILENMECGFAYANNHYFFCLLGLLWITHFTENIPCYTQMKCKAQDELNDFLKKSIQQDGSLYEGSIYYHRFVTEALLEYLYFNDIADSLLLNSAFQMVVFIQGVETAGFFPGIGDNDSGRLLPFPTYFEYSSRKTDVILFFYKQIYGTDNLKKENIYSDFGLYFIRCNLFEVGVRCDSLKNKKKSRFIGSHYHNDQLSLYISFAGEEITIDSGTYLYISHNNYRINNLKTSRHNTVSIDEFEQSRIHNDWTYTKRSAIGQVEEISENSIKCQVKYMNGIIHKREVSVSSRVIVVSDWLINENHGTVNLYFAPHIKVNMKEDDIILTLLSGKSLIIKGSAPMKIEETQIFPEYGKRVATHKLTMPLENKVSQLYIYKQ